MARRRHDDVEEEVGAAGGDQRVNVAGDDGSFRENSAARPPARSASRSARPTTRKWNFRGRLQPCPAHRAAADQGGLELHRRPLPGKTIGVLRTIAVNVYENNGGSSPCQAGGARL